MRYQAHPSFYLQLRADYADERLEASFSLSATQKEVNTLCSNILKLTTIESESILPMTG